MPTERWLTFSRVIACCLLCFIWHREHCIEHQAGLGAFLKNSDKIACIAQHNLVVLLHGLQHIKASIAPVKTRKVAISGQKILCYRFSK